MDRPDEIAECSSQKQELTLKAERKTFLEDILEELHPKRKLSRNRLRILKYKRINTAFLTPQWIRKHYEEKMVDPRYSPNIIPMDDYLIFQYKNYPSFYLNMEDGRLYFAPSKNTNLERTEQTASIFMELIKERVIGFKRVEIKLPQSHHPAAGNR